MALSAVRLSDCGASMLPDRIFRNALIWLGVVAVSLLVMVRPVYATSTPATQFTTGNTGTTVYSSGASACNAAWNSGAFASSIANGWSTSVSYNIASNACMVTCTGGAICGIYSTGSYGAGIVISAKCASPLIAVGGYCNDSITCPSGQHLVGTAPNQTCEADPPCPAAGTLFNSGYYDVGTDPSLFAPRRPCDGLCELGYNGTGIIKRALVVGIYHYYTQGEYRYVGDIGFCADSGAGSSLGALVDTPPSTCAPGQSALMSSSGSLKCYDDATGQASSGDSTAATDAAAAANAAAAASAVDAAATLASDSGLSTTAVETAQAYAAAAWSFAVPTGSAGGSAGGSGGTGGTNDPVVQNFCKDNPDSPICVEQDFGTVPEVDLGGTSISVAINPVAVGGAGSCPAPSPLTIRGQTYFFKWDTFCTFANGIRPILLAFAWLSAAGIMVGGFKS